MSDPSDSIQVRHVGKVTVVRLGQKYCDARCASEFHRRLTDIVDRGCPEGLLLDLSEIEYADSSFHSVLLLVWRLQTEKGPFAVCGARPSIQHMLEITGLRPTFTSYPSLEAALSRLNAAGQDQPAPPTSTPGERHSS